ncbi:MAG: 50S ribosomal protein L11 methyltransferase [Deltaproteobacteria bacterium]|nr:50S ribosomal protein L11 methyltransferase [Deltaproteobacteria bacterium]
MQDWLLATLVAPPVAGEAVSAALFEAGAEGIWEDYPDQQGRLVFKSGFAQGREMYLMAQLPGSLRRVAEALGLSATDFELTLELRKGENYAESWKKDLKPIAVSPRLVVAPSWWTGPIAYENSAKILRLDPGSAFGSGHHPTTYMCLRLMIQLDESGLKPASILDLGAGSGVLAIAAALIWPQALISAIDDDPETLFAFKSNITLNGLEDRLEAWEGTLATFEDRRFDLILANLTRNVLIDLAPDLSSKIRSPGRLILSGLLENQSDDIIKKFSSYGFSLERHLGLDEWSALSLSELVSSQGAAREIVEIDREGEENNVNQDSSEKELSAQQTNDSPSRDPL